MTKAGLVEMASPVILQKANLNGLRGLLPDMFVHRDAIAECVAFGVLESTFCFGQIETRPNQSMPMQERIL